MSGPVNSSGNTGFNYQDAYKAISEGGTSPLSDKLSELLAGSGDLSKKQAESLKVLQNLTGASGTQGGALDPKVQEELRKALEAELKKLSDNIDHP